MVFSDNIDNTIAYHHDCLSLVERLRVVNGEEYPYANEVVRSLCHEAADRIAAIEAQLAEAADERDKALEELGKVIMACPVGQRSMPISATVASMRTRLSALEVQTAELAEVQAERDAAREYAMQARLREARLRENAAKDARVSAVSRASRTEAALAEARKALEQAEQQLDYGQVNAAHRIIISALLNGERKG